MSDGRDLKRGRGGSRRGDDNGYDFFGNSGEGGGGYSMKRTLFTSDGSEQGDSKEAVKLDMAGLEAEVKRDAKVRDPIQHENVAEIKQQLIGMLTFVDETKWRYRPVKLD